MFINKLAGVTGPLVTPGCFVSQPSCRNPEITQNLNLKSTFKKQVVPLVFLYCVPVASITTPRKLFC